MASPEVSYPDSLGMMSELLGIDGETVRLPAGWGNPWGSTFGGYVAAVLLNQFENSINGHRPISTAHISFVQPLRQEPEAYTSVEVHRQGRTATAMSGSIQQNGAAVAIGVAWATDEIDQVQRVEVTCPNVGPPSEYDPRESQDPSTFIGRDFEFRVVPTSDESPRMVQWMRLKRAAISAGELWPTAALGLVADMVGAGPSRAAQLSLGQQHALLSLDLSLHIVGEARGPWLLGVFDNVALDRGRAVGLAELYNADGGFVASVSQASLVRGLR